MYACTVCFSLAFSLTFNLHFAVCIRLETNRYQISSKRTTEIFLPLFRILSLRTFVRCCCDRFICCAIAVLCAVLSMAVWISVSDFDRPMRFECNEEKKDEMKPLPSSIFICSFFFSLLFSAPSSSTSSSNAAAIVSFSFLVFIVVQLLTNERFRFCFQEWIAIWREKHFELITADENCWSRQTQKNKHVCCASFQFKNEIRKTQKKSEKWKRDGETSEGSRRLNAVRTFCRSRAHTCAFNLFHFVSFLFRIVILVRFIFTADECILISRCDTFILLRAMKFYTSGTFTCR